MVSVYSIDLSRNQYIDTSTKEVQVQVNDCAGNRHGALVCAGECRDMRKGVYHYDPLTCVK